MLSLLGIITGVIIFLGFIFILCYAIASIIVDAYRNRKALDILLSAGLLFAIVFLPGYLTFTVCKSTLVAPREKIGIIDTFCINNGGKLQYLIRVKNLGYEHPVTKDELKVFVDNELVSNITLYPEPIKPGGVSNLTVFTIEPYVKGMLHKVKVVGPTNAEEAPIFC